MAAQRRKSLVQSLDRQRREARAGAATVTARYSSGGGLVAAMLAVPIPCCPEMAQSPHWQCIAGCGACCRLDPDLRQDALAALSPEQRRTYLEMVGPDGWCIHYDSGGRRCRVYNQRPDFCRVSNLLALFAPHLPAAEPEQWSGEAHALAISCCRQQIRSEYGGRARVMRRFERAIRRR
jgi:Predicted Fe-S-cluster oxidoreductase